MEVTIFDSIKYPVSDKMRYIEEVTDLPKEISDYFIGDEFSDSERTHDGLRRLILEYNTDECRIRKYYDNI